MKSLVMACACSLSLFATSVFAAGKFYVEPNVSRDRLKIEGAAFNLIGAGLKLGMHLRGHHGIELQYTQGTKEAKLNELQVELDNRISAFYRYGSLPSRPIRGYFLLGHTRTTINYDGPTSASDEVLDDFAWALGAEEKLKRWKPAIFNVEYAQHYNHHSDVYYIISMGLRYEF